jgi:hypothetical protein
MHTHMLCAHQLTVHKAHTVMESSEFECSVGACKGYSKNQKKKALPKMWGRNEAQNESS